MVVQTRYQLKERALLAAAHNLNNTQHGRRQSAEIYAEMHYRRTGEEVDPEHELEIADEELEFVVRGEYELISDQQQRQIGTRAFPISGDSDDEKRELVLKRIAHNPNVTDGKRLEAAKEMAELHLKRTGEEIDPVVESRVGNDNMEFIV